jgi:hypothetical protein
MLRSFGIDLTNQSAWVATGALAVMVGSGQPSSRHSLPYLISLLSLTASCAVAIAACTGVFELIRGSRLSVLTLAAAPVHCVLTWVPVTVFASLAANTAALLPRFLLVVSLCIAANLVPRVAEHGWSTSTLLASICNLVAAAVIAHDCCQKKI